MKLIHQFFALLLLATTLPAAAQKNEAYDGHLTFRVNNISKAHDTLFVSLTTNLAHPSSFRPMAHNVSP